MDVTNKLPLDSMTTLWDRSLAVREDTEHTHTHTHTHTRFPLFSCVHV